MLKYYSYKEKQKNEKTLSSIFLISATSGLAVYWSPPAAEEGGQPSAPIAHDRREECFVKNLMLF